MSQDMEHDAERVVFVEHEIIRKFPSRACEATKVNGDPCAAGAMAFMEKPRCGAHATPAARKLNAERRDAWWMEVQDYDDPDPPSDAIIEVRGKKVAVIFGYRPDAVAAIGKIAGARFDKEEKCWMLPYHRLGMVVSVARLYFKEIVIEVLS